MKQKQRTKAAIYVRSATENSKEIANQTNDLTKIINRNDESLVGVYVDNGCSGLTLERPELRRLLNDAKKGWFTKLYLRDISRISRDMKQLRTAYRQLKRDGVAIFLKDGPGKPTDFAFLKTT